jgi:hypothetical protein
VDQTFAGQDEWMEELLGDEYYVELFAEIAESEPITEAIDEVPLSIPATKVTANVVMDGVEMFQPSRSWRHAVGATRC